jgi:iron-sulfur cluster assembly protein
MGIKLTEAAATQISKFKDEYGFGEESFLRVGITAGGCSGFGYSIGFDKEFDDAKDSKFEQNGVAVVVDKKSQLLLDGTTLDWHQSIEKQGFTFDNPNAVKSCGCGSSFQA